MPQNMYAPLTLLSLWLLVRLLKKSFSSVLVLQEKIELDFECLTYRPLFTLCVIKKIHYNQ